MEEKQNNNNKAPPKKAITPIPRMFGFSVAFSAMQRFINSLKAGVIMGVKGDIVSQQ